jgi:hypothetical protein
MRRERNNILKEVRKVQGITKWITSYKGDHRAHLMKKGWNTDRIDAFMKIPQTLSAMEGKLQSANEILNRNGKLAAQRIKRARSIAQKEATTGGLWSRFYKPQIMIAENYFYRGGISTGSIISKGQIIGRNKQADASRRSTYRNIQFDQIGYDREVVRLYNAYFRPRAIYSGQYDEFKNEDGTSRYKLKDRSEWIFEGWKVPADTLGLIVADVGTLLEVQHEWRRINRAVWKNTLVTSAGDNVYDWRDPIDTYVIEKSGPGWGKTLAKHMATGRLLEIAGRWSMPIHKEDEFGYYIDDNGKIISTKNKRDLPTRLVHGHEYFSEVFDTAQRTRGRPRTDHGMNPWAQAAWDKEGKFKGYGSFEAELDRYVSIERNRRIAWKRFKEGFGPDWGMTGMDSLNERMGRRPQSPSWFTFGEEEDLEGPQQTQRASLSAFNKWRKLHIDIEKMKNPSHLAPMLKKIMFYFHPAGIGEKGIIHDTPEGAFNDWGIPLGRIGYISKPAWERYTSKGEYVSDFEEGIMSRDMHPKAYTLLRFAMQKMESFKDKYSEDYTDYETLSNQELILHVNRIIKSKELTEATIKAMQEAGTDIGPFTSEQDPEWDHISMAGRTGYFGSGRYSKSGGEDFNFGRRIGRSAIPIFERPGLSITQNDMPMSMMGILTDDADVSWLRENEAEALADISVFHGSIIEKYRRK